MRAKQKRAASLGQSARFYTLGGVQTGYAKGGAGGQGYGKTNPSIGSMVSLGITKQIRKAGGNNICKQSQGAKSDCSCRGPISYCPNCAGRVSAGTNTLTKNARFASKYRFFLLNTH